jgi:hypothetical protein
MTGAGTELIARSVAVLAVKHSLQANKLYESLSVMGAVRAATGNQFCIPCWSGYEGSCYQSLRASRRYVQATTPHEVLAHIAVAETRGYEVEWHTRDQEECAPGQEVVEHVAAFAASSEAALVPEFRVLPVRSCDGEATHLTADPGVEFQVIGLVEDLGVTGSGSEECRASMYTVDWSPLALLDVGLWKLQPHKAACSPDSAVRLHSAIVVARGESSVTDVLSVCP